MIAALDRVLQISDQHLKAAASGQSDFFGLATEPADDSGGAALCVDYAAFDSEWTKDELLACEKETLGLYLSGHPVDRYESELGAFTSCRLAELRPGRKRVAGLIMSSRIIKTRRGRMAVVTLDDKTARVEMTVYRDAFERYIDKLVTDRIVVVEGQCDVDEFTGEHSIQAEEIMSIEQARNRLARALVLNVSPDELGNGFIGRLGSLIEDYGDGKCPVAIEYSTEDNRARLRLGDRWRVNAADSLLDGLRMQLGEHRVEVEY